MAFPTGWNYKHKVTIQASQVPGAGDISSAPVVLTEANLLSALFSNVQGKEVNSNYLLSDANLQAYYRFQSNFNDSGPNGYNLTPANSPTNNTAGKFGNGADFNAGSSQYLSIAHASCPNLAMTGSRTISCWVKADSLASNYSVVAKRGESNTFRGYSLKVGSSGVVIKITGLTTNDTVTSSVTIKTGVWYHIVAVYDSANSKLKIWVNGRKTEVTASGSSVDSGMPFTIGCDYTGSGDTPFNFFDGMIDDVNIYNRALSDGEVLGLYAGGQDIRITSDLAGTTELPFEVVNMDIVNSKAKIWVKCTPNGSTDVDLYVWAGNSSATPYEPNATYGSQNVWTNYRLVLHYQGNFRDSSPEGNHLTGVNGPTNVDGKIGAGGGFDFENTGGEDQYAYIVEGSHNLYLSGSQTWLCWYKPESLYNFQHLMAFYEAATGVNNRIYAGSTGNITLNLAGLTDTAANLTSVLSAGVWSMVTAIYESGVAVKMFHNTTKQSDASSGTVTDPSSDFAIGRAGEDDANYIDGIMDETWIYNGAMSDDRQGMHYANMNNPSAFAIASAVQEETSKSFLFNMV